MAEVRPFRALRYDAALADPALNIAPPYDVISPAEQRALYERSAHNIVRIEYGETRDGDSAADNRYTRAARDLRAWRDAGVLRLDDAPAIYAYRQSFTWAGERHERHHWFVALRLEPWDAGIVKPHERTLSNPKADRLNLLRATNTQVSPVYSIFHTRAPFTPPPDGAPLAGFDADGQHHALSAITDAGAIASFAAALAEADVYIADGHHRYETALAFRDEQRAAASAWTGDEPSNFVLMALTYVGDRGLLVLPTHRLVTPPAWPGDARERIARHFRIDAIAPGDAERALADALRAGDSAFIALGLGDAGGASLLTLIDRAGVEALMPPGESPAWKRLDVNVLQYGILRDVFGIDDAALAAGGAVAYTQDAGEARAAVERGAARVAFLLNATPVAQIGAVADANGRMPQKSTYFYPKLPTGLVLRAV